MEEHAPVAMDDSSSTPPKKQFHCRFFATRRGCLNGDACPWIHDQSRVNSPGNAPQPKDRPQHKPISQGPSVPVQEGRQYVAPPVRSDLVVPKPVSRAQVEDPREFQIRQLRRRFAPIEKAEEDGTNFAFQMVPSDPDFPFEMVGLECVLHVPSTYPQGGMPSLEVKNKEMDRGYQINVERRFTHLAETSSPATLLGLMNSLDKQLESLLGEQKVETVKIIRNNPAVRNPERTRQTGQKPQSAVSATAKPFQELKPQLYSSEQRSAAEARRATETRQLEARLGRLPLFSKSADGIAYTLPIEPRKMGELPVPLQAVKTVRLFVPMLYPLEHCRVELLGVSRDASRTAEIGFERRAKEFRTRSLMAHVNSLVMDMHILATEPREEADINKPDISEMGSMDITASQATKVSAALLEDDDHPHIKVIPRPPEWALNDEADGTGHENSDSSGSGDEFSDGIDEENATDLAPESAPSGPERGVLLSFPFLELYSIEVLELISLCVTIKCERCRDTMNVSNLRNSGNADHPGSRSESCKKCANKLNIGYRRELMHAHCVRAGYLDLDGCTVVDMLPSHFIPTCSECSTSYPIPGVVSVRGDSSTAVCRECHKKMSFKIPEVKFLLVSTAAVRANRAPPRKKPKEKLGIVAGEELPRRGRCAHYSKSYRWFRFSCCSQVFACDKCHDLESDHPNEHANRMICGFCSREQNYRPEDCQVCHSVLVAKKGSGFWEGGKGTRDKARMSRKDPRKYKRASGTKRAGGLGGESLKRN